MSLDLDPSQADSIKLAPASELTRGVMFSESFKKDAIKKPSFFTRKRLLTFTIVVGLLLRRILTSTQIALDGYFAMFGLDKITGVPSQQSFSEARSKLKWEAFQLIFNSNVNDIYERGTKKWHGYRISAIDGSKIQLPADSNFEVIFGTAGRGDSSPTAQASMLYDLLNGHIIDARIGPMSTGERKLAMEHIEHLKNHASFSKELCILDRGYPSFELIEDFECKSVSYIMRLKSKFNVDIDEMGLGIHQYSLTQKGHNPINVLIVKFELSSGEIETLLTNLFDQDINEEVFKDLYFLRWGIETQFSIDKEKLEIENFSSKTENGIYQDFYASVYLYNMVSIAKNEMQPIIDKDRENKGNKYKYTLNINQTIGVFKDKLIIALLDDDAEKRANSFMKIINSLAKKVVPIRPGRSVTRKKHPRKARFHFNKKSNT
jgi:hypothetical protein